MNVHLITSQSFRLANMEIKKIVKDNTYLTINVIGSNTNELFEECGYAFFLDDMKYIVVKNFFKDIDSDSEERIMKYFSNVNERVCLIFLESKVDGRKKSIKKIKKDFSLINIDLDYKNIYGYINDYIKLNNFTMDYDFTKYIVGLYGLEIDIIFSELDKVFTYYEFKKTNLSINNTKSILSSSINSNSFKLIDAILNKDLSLSLKLLDDLITYKVEPISIIILLAREYRLVSYVKTYTDRKMNLSTIALELKMQEWQIQKYYQYSISLNKAEINSIMKLLAVEDEKIKTGEHNSYNALQLIILDICV
ncbi:MAG: DNA polymerase III subunit delta [bacterium]